MVVSPYYDYDYDISSGAATAAGGVAGFMLVFVMVFYLLLIGFSVLTYVLQSLGMYTIAKRRGIHHPWLAWVPVGNMWLLGSISDQYQYVAKGRVRGKRRVLLGLTIGLYAAMIPMFVSLIAAAVSGVMGSPSTEELLGATLAIALLTYFVVIVLAIILTVFQYMALYDLFASCDPGNAVMYLVLTIFLGVVLPFFIFSCRNKDHGMPERKPAAPVQPVFQPTWQPQGAPVGEIPAAEEMPVSEQPAEETEKQTEE